MQADLKFTKITITNNAPNIRYRVTAGDQREHNWDAPDYKWFRPASGAASPFSRWRENKARLLNVIEEDVREVVEQWKLAGVELSAEQILQAANDYFAGTSLLAK